MAEVSSLSSHSRVNPPPAWGNPHEVPPGQEVRPPRPRSEGLGEGDPRKTAEAILIKTVLEGLDFQTAREEVLAAVEAQQSPHTPPQGDTVAFSLEATELHVEATHLEVDVATPTSSLHVEYTHLEASLTQVSLSVNSGRRNKDPLVVDLDGGGPDTTGAQGARLFDLEGNGSQAPTSFVRGETAFLALDRNGNGVIDSGAELFGDQHGALDGFEELAKFDLNQDGRIDPKDHVYTALELLFGDGRTQSLPDSGITALSLQAVSAPATTEYGDDILRQATASLQNGATVGTFALGLQRFDAHG